MEEIASNNTINQTESSSDIEYEKNGHHGTMALILLGALFSFQFLILFWKQKHQRSFQAVTLFGLWLMPMYIFGFQAKFWRFLTIWTCYSLVNSWVLYMASRKPLDHKTPRLVYKWYSVVYKVSYAVGITGYSIIMLTFFGIIQLIYTGPEVTEFGLLLLCYGLYFGVLSRDFVEICTDSMTSTLGYYNKDGFPRKHLRANICAICGVAATEASEIGEKQQVVRFTGENRHDSQLTEDKQHALQIPGKQRVFQLACRHVFHDECIRGWCLIGKKDICPYCKEKVDMKEFKTNPWDTQQQLYLSLLDGVRYLVVWQPVIFALVQLAYHLMGLN
ncbi:16588_t:CDS:2 [Acaulospora morrowiae]|uniref:16588_t:CDS:1 n=1 Tax=Acaulospora morrowiae TaxID=94023 RepID=A0A9N8VQ03_9GLOM|nr:16588_t:CDS:2 [Acaulospora morrowiae]